MACLHVAKVWQIEYKRSGMSGGAGQDALYRILRMFNVDNSAEDICTKEFVVRRSDLQELRLHIAERDGVFREHAGKFSAELTKIGIGREKFIEVLDSLINDSDQSDAYVHVSWI